MKFAYADPPYIGCARKHYRDDPQCAEVDHAELIVRLVGEYDGWALSCSEVSLRELLPLTPEGTRVGAWVKRLVFFRPGVRVAYAWEPVLFSTPRKTKVRRGAGRTIYNWLQANTTFKTGCAGAKPDAFCFWLFDLVGARPDDEFCDLFPGSGNVTRCWKIWCGQQRLDLGEPKRCDAPLFAEVETG